MSEEVSVVVGIRIRPFNDREKKLGATCCVDTDGNTTILNANEDDPKAREPKKIHV